MVRCDAQFKSQVVVACYDAMEHAGFIRYRQKDVDWPLDSNFHLWVGLNTGLCADFVEVNPFVGVHAVEIMKFYTSLEGRKYDRGIATYARHMGELVPNVRAFRFNRSTDVAAEANRLARLYATVGLAFAKAIGAYEPLLPLLHQRIDALGAYPERYASCLYLMGRRAEARSFVNEFLLSHRSYFEGFSTPFLQLLDEVGRADHGSG